MCTTSKIQLSNNDYACSIIENAAFFLHSQKEKYLIRINDALKHFYHPRINVSPSDTEIYNLIIYIIKNQIKTHNFTGYPTFIKVFRDKLSNIDEPLSTLPQIQLPQIHLPSQSQIHLPQIHLPQIHLPQIQQSQEIFGSQQSLSGLMSRRQSDITSRRQSDITSRRQSDTSRRPSNSGRRFSNRRRSSDISSFKFPDISNRNSTNSSINTELSSIEDEAITRDNSLFKK
jgi:hypothetical protein